MAVDDGGECCGQIGQGIDGVEFASLDERGNGYPVLGPCIMPRKERVLGIECNWPDGSLDAAVVNLDATVGEEELQTIPVFGDVRQGFAERRLGRNTGTVMGKPGLHVIDERRRSFAPTCK